MVENQKETERARNYEESEMEIATVVEEGKIKETFLFLSLSQFHFIFFSSDFLSARPTLPTTFFLLQEHSRDGQPAP